MTPLKNDNFIRALLRQPVDRTPVWVMRQAGRYLPEYREVRAKAGDFMTLCKTPELACEVTLQPLDRFDLDAAIIFSDILTIPDAMGLGLSFAAGEGPRFSNPIRSLKDVQALGVPDPETELKYVCDAIRTTRQALDGRVPLIGFSGSPWTLATYMIEGQGSKTFSKAKAMMYREPATMHALLSLLAESVTQYLNAQIAAGAQAVMIFDTWGGLLSTQYYQDFSLAYMTQIINGLQREVDGQRIPVTLFTKGGGGWLETIADSGCDGLGLDWTLNIGDARARVGNRVALQGNLDPAALYADEATLRGLVRNIKDSFGDGVGHVFNLGHGIEKDVQPEQLAILVDEVHK